MRPSRKEDLIDGATRVFERTGFHATSLDTILAEAGVSRMTLYNHFESKEDLIVAALERYGQRSRAHMFERIRSATDDPRERLLSVFDELGAWLTGGAFSGCMFARACAEFDAESSPVRRVAAEHCRLIAEGLAEIAAEADLSDPDEVGRQLAMLRAGAIEIAREIGSERAGFVASTARAAARAIVDAHRVPNQDNRDSTGDQRSSTLQ